MAFKVLLFYLFGPAGHVCDVTVNLPSRVVFLCKTDQVVDFHETSII